MNHNYSGDGGVTPSAGIVFEADGRPAILESGSVGNELRTYDVDGNLITRTEPTASGLTSPATYTYTYYADDRKKDLSVSSSGFSMTGTLQYAYTTDGNLQTEKINSPSVSMELQHAYTAAGRQTRVYNSTTTFESTTYDIPSQTSPSQSRGVVVSRTFPITTLSGFSYDDEGEIQQIGFPDGSTLANTFSDRGEVMDQQYMGAGSSGTAAFVHHRSKNVNGLLEYVPLPSVSPDPNTTTIFSAPTYDSNNGTLRSDSVETETDSDGNTERGGTSGYSFDADGRQVTHGSNSTDLPNPYCTAKNTTVNSTTHAYDAVNRLINQSSSSTINRQIGKTCTNSKTTTTNSTTISWGPNGQPIQVAGNTLHWDGNQLLFVTNASGQMIDLRLGREGDIAPQDPNYTGFTYHARDWSGSTLLEEQSGGSSALHIWDGASSGYDLDGSDQSGYRAVAVVLPYDKSDGLTVLSPSSNNGYYGVRAQDSLSLNGVRAYDGNLGSWTTPDSMVGNVSQPESLKRFSYAGDNPIQNEDPTGMYPEPREFSWMFNLR